MYSVAGRPEQAWPLFRRYGGEQAPVMMDRLAAAYDEQGKAFEAATVRKEIERLGIRGKQ
jgi:hypothetical protein